MTETKLAQGALGDSSCPTLLPFAMPHSFIALGDTAWQFRVKVLEPVCLHLSFSSITYEHMMGLDILVKQSLPHRPHL